MSATSASLQLLQSAVDAIEQTMHHALGSEPDFHHTAQTDLLSLSPAGRWGQRYPPIVASWRRHWERVIPFFAYPQDVRRVLYTTNAIESLNMQLRKVTKNRGHFPNDEAAIKLLYLALRNATAKWKNAGREWYPALTQFSILFADRFAAVGM